LSKSDQIQTEDILQEESEKDDLNDLKAKLGEAEKISAGKELKINALEREIADLAKRHREAENKLADAVSNYKTLAIGNHAEIPAELVGGASIEEINNSLISAKILVDKIRRGLENEVMATQIPIGAPVRRDFDISGLSPIEKIKYAMNKSK